jgi:hydrogenase nickel incorporation protein HypA/HybF
MHELSVTQNLLDIALRHGQAANARQITDLYLVIGQLSSIVDESVQFYWDFVAKGTPAEGARLHFQRIPTQVHCLDCELSYQPAGEDLACPTCDGIHIEIAAGDEFYLDAIGVET